VGRVSLPSADWPFVFLVFVLLLNDTGYGRRGFGLFNDPASSSRCSYSVDWWLCRRARSWRCSAWTVDLLIVDEVVHFRIFFFFKALFVFLFHSVHFVAVHVRHYALRVGSPTASLAVRHRPSSCEGSCLSGYATFQETSHHEGGLIWGVILPVVVDILHVEFGLEFCGVVFWHFVHVAETGEAIAPGDLTGLVEYKPALRATAVFEFPGAHRAPIDPVFLISQHLQRRSPAMEGMYLEAALEQTTRTSIFVVFVLLHSIGFLLLQFLVLFKRLPSGEQLNSANEDARHVAYLHVI
jgi:hypothetical protein